MVAVLTPFKAIQHPAKWKGPLTSEKNKWPNIPAQFHKNGLATRKSLILTVENVLTLLSSKRAEGNAAGSGIEFHR